MTSRLSEARALLGDTLFEWIEDGVVQRGAALAYYVLLSLGPMLLLLVGGLQVFFAQEAVRDRVLEVIARFVGARAASTAQTVLQDAQAPAGLSLTSVLSIAALLFAATAVFANVRGSLDAIWGVEKKKKEEGKGEEDEGGEPRMDRRMLVSYVIGFIRTRVRGFVMIVMTGLILLVSFALTSTASVLEQFLEGSLPLGWAWVQILDGALSIAVIGLLFGTMFRTMSERRLDWSAVWIGAYLTAALFVLGKQLMAYFIATASWTSYYGPGTSVVAFLFWVFLSAQIFYFGAEFTQVWARRYGHLPTTPEIQ